MNVTFGTKQELRSLEFGQLLYNILPKGVYDRPTISMSSGNVTVSGGTFLFYNTGSDHYVAKVDEVTLTLPVTAGKYLFIQYTYNASQVSQPALVLSDDVETAPSRVRLCRFINTSADPASLAVDESCMELAGSAEGAVDTGLIDYISYKQNQYGTQDFAMAFRQKVTGNSGTGSVASVSSLAGLDPAKAQYLYINSEGVLTVADSTVPRFGKLVVAEKAANAAFTLIRYPHRAEMKGWDLELDKPAVSAGSKEETVYNDGASNTEAHFSTLGEGNTIIALSGLINAMVSHIGKLERDLDKLNGRLEYLEQVKDYLNTQITIPARGSMPDPMSTEKLEFRNVEIASAGNVNIKGSVTVDSSTSSFGTATSPIHNLYVTESLYTDQLFVTE